MPLNQEITVGDLWEDIPPGLKNFLTFILRQSSNEKFKALDVASLPFVALKEVLPALYNYKENSSHIFDKVSVAAAAQEIDRALAKLDNKVVSRMAELKEEVIGCL